MLYMYFQVLNGKKFFEESMRCSDIPAKQWGKDSRAEEESHCASKRLPMGRIRVT